MQKIKNFVTIAAQKENAHDYFITLFQFAHDTRARAEVIAAYAIHNKKFPEHPDGNAVRLARDLVQNIANEKPEQHIPAHARGALTTEWPENGPSDRARREAAEYRKKHGSLFTAPRMVRTVSKTKVGRLDVMAGGHYYFQRP